MALDGTEPEVPQRIKDLRMKAIKLGYSDFWYSLEDGLLYAMHPDHTHIEDERVSITQGTLYREQKEKEIFEIEDFSGRLLPIVQLAREVALISERLSEDSKKSSLGDAIKVHNLQRSLDRVHILRRWEDTPIDVQGMKAVEDMGYILQDVGEGASTRDQKEGVGRYITRYPEVLEELTDLKIRIREVFATEDLEVSVHIDPETGEKHLWTEIMVFGSKDADVRDFLNKLDQVRSEVRSNNKSIGRHARSRVSYGLS